MDFFRREPAPPLARYIDHFWLVRSGPLPHTRQVLFPDGGVTVHFNFATPPGLVDPDTGGVRRFSTTWISGERTVPYTLDVPGEVALGGIRFRPGAVFPFLGFPAAELSGRVVELDDLDGLDAREWFERMGEAAWPDAAFDLMADFVSRRLSAAAELTCPSVEASIAALRRAPPGASVRRLAAQVGVSHRTMLRRFDQWVGVRPKLIQRVLRFQRVIELEDRDGSLDWARVALRAGYYDQAHMIRDFRHFAGTTPARYRAARLSYPNYRPAE